MLLEGKVAVVTGGTRGIGFAIVRKYLANGAKVVLFGSRQETVDKALEKLKEENAQWEVDGMCPKLTDASEVEKAILAVKEKFGRIDILVNNAGISQSTPLYDYTPDEFDKVINLNVCALFYAILPTAKIMKEQGGGCIINTSSMVSISGQPSGVGYPTSKSAVNGMTFSLARELAKKENITIVCGHYEGIDERIIEEIGDMEISIGDYVLTGGELPALVITDEVCRMLPGVLKSEEGR